MLKASETIAPARRVEGSIRVPGDKSISHRAVFLGAMASGRQVITGLSPADDVAATVRCARALGAAVERLPDGRVVVSAGDPPADAVTVDAGNSGTTARLGAAVAAALGAACILDGDESLRRRPMRRVAEPLDRMGARVELSPEGTLPMRVAPAPLRGIRYVLPVASAQVKSAVLLAGLCAEGETTVIEPVPTRDHTERMLEAMGVRLARDGHATTVRGGIRPEGIAIDVPGDFSSAAFFLAAAALLPGSEVRVMQCGINPSRTGLLDALAAMGVPALIEPRGESAGEPTGDVIVRHGALRGARFTDPERVVAMIDELPLVAVLGTQAEGVTEVRGAAELRRKESDRIEAVCRNLRAMGARIDEFDDGFAVHGPTRLHGATVNSCGDHRLAMTLAVAALIADGPTTLEDATAVSVSYPGFFDDLRILVR